MATWRCAGCKKARDAHSMGVYWLKIEPIWDPLRPDRRFIQLLQQLRLAQ
jgi:hypothetical protein